MPINVRKYTTEKIVKNEQSRRSSATRRDSPSQLETNSVSTAKSFDEFQTTAELRARLRTAMSTNQTNFSTLSFLLALSVGIHALAERNERLFLAPVSPTAAGPAAAAASAASKATLNQTETATSLATISRTETVASPTAAQTNDSRFEASQWREAIKQEQQAIAADFSKHISRVVSSRAPAQAAPRDNDLAIAQLAEASQGRLRRFSDDFKAEYKRRPSALTPADFTLAKHLDHQIRVLKLTETIHRARSILLDQQQQILKTIAEKHDPALLLANNVFWAEQRPWIEAELVSLQYFSDGTPANSQRAFFKGVQLDLQRLTQAALELENRRIDAWTMWRQLHPGNQKVASSYAKFIEAQKESLRSFAEMALEHSQHQVIESGLRKVASRNHDKRR